MNLCDDDLSTCECSGRGGNSRWCKLTQGVQAFLAAASAGPADSGNRILSEDRFSRVFFDGSIATATSPFTDNFVNESQFWNASNGVVPHMASTSPSGLTSIGNAMTDAIQKLLANNGSASENVIILFSDGEQTTGDWLVDTGTGVRIVGDKDNPGSSRVPCGTESECLNAVDHRVIGITINQTGAHNAVFSQLTGANGFYRFEDGANIAELMVDAFNEVYGFATPEYVAISAASTAADQNLDFPLNENVTQLILSATTPDEVGGYRFRIFRDGVEVPDSVIVREQNDSYSLFKITFQNHRDITSQGQWSFRASRPAGVPAARLRLAAIADDHRLDAEAKVTNTVPTVNTPLRHEAEIIYLGEPIDDAEVTVEIIAPGDELQAVLAAHNSTATGLPQAVDITTCASQKYYSILANAPEKLTAYNNKQRRVFELESQGDGRYTNADYRPPFTGDYQLLYTVSFTNTEGATIERVFRRSVNVTFREVSLNPTINIEDFTAVQLDQVAVIQEGIAVEQRVGSDKRTRKTLKNFNIGIQPTYQNPTLGKTVIGPGYDIGIHVQGKNINNTVTTDLCNGGYTLAFQSTKRNPRIKVNVMGQEPYEGKALFIERPYLNRQYGLHLVGGLTIPQSALEMDYENGYYLELGVNYRFSQHWGFGLLGAQSVFSHPTNESEDLTINSAIGLLDYYATLPVGNEKRLEALLQAGGGFYQADNEDTELGYAYGAGLQYRLGSATYLHVGGKVNTIDELDYSFVQLGGGLRFRF